MQQHYTVEHSEEFARVWAEIATRQPENKVEPGLERVSRVLELMGNPERAYKTIHIGGTNGKTSTARMTERLLHNAGLRTGRITSPHLNSPTERISIDTHPISEEAFVQAFHDVQPFALAVDAESVKNGGIPLTMFEFITVMQFQAFANAPVDVAVVEVGLGGRMDATNVIEADVAVLTPIALDHTEILGETADLIAAEKAGIFKKNSIAIVAAQPYAEALEVIKDRAAELGIQAAIQGEQIDVVSRTPGVGGQMLSLQGIAARYDDVFVTLLGEHQAQNALMALAACEALLTGGEQPLDAELVRDSFAEVTSPGRAEVVRLAPTIVVDGAHNPAGAEALVATIRENFRFTETVGILGILDSKDAEEILAILEPLLDTVVITQSASPRAIPADVLAGVARDVFGDEDRVVEVASLPDAIQTAVDIAERTGDEFSGIVAAGSLTLAAEVRQLLGVERDA